MDKETLLSGVSLVATCTGFFLFLTVLLAANQFIKVGTVGKMSATFYALASFNGCMWTIYGVLLGKFPIILPNAWSVVTTTFAMCSYFLVLGREVEAAKAKAAAGPPPTTTITTTKEVVEMSPIITRNEATAMNRKDPSTDANNTTNTTSVEVAPTSVTSPGDSTTSATAITAAPVTQADLQAAADAFVERYAAGLKATKIILGLNFCFIALVIGARAFGYPDTAISISGTMGVVMATLLFTGPLDQVSWIVKNKNAIPLDPLMTVVGLCNALVWMLYGFLTNDFFVYSPNCVAVVLCVMQVGLIVYFPRRPVVE